MLFSVGVAACDTASDCADLYAEVAKPGAGVDKLEQELAKQMQAYGSEAIPYLLPMLKEDDEALVKLASCTVSDLDGLTDDHLDALIAACESDCGWLPPAIASIGSDRAIGFLVDELRRDKRRETQITWAFKTLGAIGVPYLVEMLQCEEGCDQDLLYTVSLLLGSLGDKAFESVPELLKLAKNSNYEEQARKAAIRAIGKIRFP